VLLLPLQRDESELGSAYQEVASLQQQLEEQQQQALQQRMAMQDALARWADKAAVHMSATCARLVRLDCTVLCSSSDCIFCFPLHHKPRLCSSPLYLGLCVAAVLPTPCHRHLPFLLLLLLLPGS
jgi:hypothetical protein